MSAPVRTHRVRNSFAGRREFARVRRHGIYSRDVLPHRTRMMSDTTFDQDGAAYHPDRAISLLANVEQLLAGCSRDRAGVRLAGITGLDALLAPDTPIGSVAAAHLGKAAKPVRAIAPAWPHCRGGCGGDGCAMRRGCVLRGSWRHWPYATPILHASAAASGHAHRRVLQVDYSADRLPEPLLWYGV